MKKSPMRGILRAEGAAVFLASAAIYFSQGWDIVLFVILLFVPDISMIGYLKDKVLGSYTYNIGHSYVLPVIFLAVSFLYNYTLGTQISLVWLAHIGIDRVLGFGLKYTTAFKDTHMQRV